MEPGGEARVKAVDGLRALAVGLVVGYHLLPVVPGGWIGVNVFFVISGWIITSLLVREAGRHGRIDLRGFYLRRFLRLTPPLVLAAAGVVALEATLVPVVDGFRWDVFAALTYWTDVRLLFVSHASALSHTWSLAVEEQFYLVWPAVLVVTLRRPGRLVRVVAVCLVISVPVMVLSASVSALTGYAPWAHAPALLAGALTAVLRDRLRVGVLAATACVVVLAAWGLVVRNEVWVYQGSVLVVVGCTAALVVHLSTTPSWLTRIFSLGPAAWIGERSYGIYLYHFPILFAFGEVSLPAGSSALAILLLSVAAAAVSFRCVEEPIRRLGRRRAPSTEMSPRPA